jgi:hypothetical protein
MCSIAIDTFICDNKSAVVADMKLVQQARGGMFSPWGPCHPHQGLEAPTLMGIPESISTLNST